MDYTDKDIRAWAVENRLNVGKRGRISADLREKWNEYVSMADAQTRAYAEEQS